MSELVLYTYWRSSSSYRVRIALGCKGLAFRAVPVNLLAREQASEEHVARSPMGYVPCLDVDGKPFVESVAIFELLEDLYPEPPLYPRDPFHRARVRAMVEMVNAGIQPLQNLHVLLHHAPGDAAERMAWGRHFNERGLEGLERAMTRHQELGVRGSFAYGQTFTAADAFLVPQVYSARRFGVDMSRFPRVGAAAEAAGALPFVAAAAPEVQPDAVPPPKG